MSNLEQASKGPDHGRGRVRLSVSVLVLVASVAAVGCNEATFLIPAPTLRGIAIPLPPPSFADEVLVHIDVEGSVPLGFDHPATQAFLYETQTGRGYFVGTDGNDFTIHDVLVDIGDNCLETWFIDGVDAEQSTLVDYKAILVEGADACAADPTCSPVDELDACLCLEKWTKGC